MATPKVLLKRSSVPGRAPAAGDLEYGELAINFADGKLYYKTSSDSIAGFVDSARVQAIADAVEVVAQAQLDSGEVTNLIDSAYVQALVPLSYLEGLIDSAYIQARQDFSYTSLTDVPDFFDSNDATILVDSAYVQARQITYNTSDFLDSNTVSLVVDSAYVQARQVDFFRDSAFVTGIVDEAYIQARDRIRDSGFVEDIVDSAYIQSRQITYDFLDSAEAIGLIDSAYVQARQLDSAANATEAINATNLNNQAASYYLNYNNLSNKPVILDTVDVSNIITTDVDKAFVDALNVDADTLDGYQAQYFIDKIDSNTARMLDSAEAIALIDSAYVQARQTNSSNTDLVTEGSTNLYYTKARVDSDISQAFDDSGNTVNVTINNFIEDKVDSAYVLARVNEAPFLDSVDAIALIDSTYVQARQDYAYGSLTGVPTTVSTFTNDANYLDSNTVTGVIDSAYLQPIARKGISAGTGISYNELTGVVSWADSADITKITFDTTTYTDANVPDTLPPFDEGNLFYFQGPDALTYSNASINVKIGQDEVVRVYNNSGSDIGKGKAVYVTGAANDFPTIALAKADAFSTVYTTIGLTSHAISNGTFGFVTMRGLFGGLDTTLFNAGDIVHISYDSAGELTNVQPQYPNFPFEIGTVLVVDSASGGAVGGCIQVNPKAEVFEGIRVQGNSRFDADLTVAGNLNILGTETVTKVQNLQVTDNFIYIGAGDTVTTLFDGTGTNDGTIKDYYEGDSDKYYFVYIYDADSANGGDLIRLHSGDSAGAFDDGTSTQINFDSDGGSETLDLSDDRTLLPIRNNIKITFETAGGHDSGDYWYGLASPINQDLGIVGNYNLPDQPYSHAGFFRDASDQKFKIFNKYDPEVEGNINTSDSSFELGTMVANTFEGDLTGDVTGTVSSISNHTTTNLTEGDNLYYTTARHDSDTLIQVDSAYVQSRQITYTIPSLGNDFVDSAYVTGLPVSTFTNDANYLDSTTVQGVIDATYIQANQTTYDFLDSAETIALIDSAYVQARVAAGTDSATVSSIILQDVDSAYVQARQSPATDSAATIALIQATVDSAYVLTRVDSDYEKTLDQIIFIYTADSGDTAFTGADDNGRSLSFTSQHQLSIYLNGLLLSGTDDVTITPSTNTITLTDPADSGDILSIVKLAGAQPYFDSSLVNNFDLTFQTFVFTADSGDTTFTGADDNGQTLAYVEDKIRVHVNGILLIDSADYIATNGTEVVLTEPTNALDVVTIERMTGRDVGVDSAYVIATIDNDYIRNRQIKYTTADFTDSAFVTGLPVSTFTNDANYLDSTTVTGVIDSAYINAAVGVANDSASTTLIIQDVVDSAYVQARQDFAYSSLTGAPTIPAFGTDYVDSATVIDIINSEGLDSDLVIALVDSAYIQLRDRFQDSSLVTSTVDSSYIQARVPESYLSTLIDSDYIELRRPAETIFNIVNNGASAYTFTGDGFSSGRDNPTLYLWRGKTYKFSVNASGHPFQIRTSSGGSAYNNGVLNNGSEMDDVIFTPDMNAPNTLVYQCTVHSGMVGNIVIIDNNSFLDSSTVTGVIDSAYVQARQITYDFLDSAEAIALIDSAYVQARTTAGTDSAATIALIEATVDSAYVQLREGAGGGLDSALIIDLIDSAYVQAREAAGGGGGGGAGLAFSSIAVSGQDSIVADSSADKLTFEAGPGISITTDPNTDTITINYGLEEEHIDSAAVVNIVDQQLADNNILQINKFYYTATAGQSVFTGSDDFGNALNVIAANTEVYLNGLLLVDSDDYSITSSTLTLTSAADSGYAISIIETVGKVKQLTLSQATFEYTADSGQTVFSGADDNGTVLSYSNTGFIDVYLNGILISEINDYTTNAAGNAITLLTAADSADFISIKYTKGNTVSPNIDLFEFVADSGQTVFTGSDEAGNTLAFTSDAIQVHVNGILLRPSIDYTTTNNDTITMTGGLDSADEVIVSAFSGDNGVYLEKFKYTADSGQTTFTGNDINGNRLGYELNNIQVFLNGILLPDSDYSATTSNSVTLTTGANTGDDLVVQSFSRATNSAPITINVGGTWTEITTSTSVSANTKNIVDCTDSAITLTLPTSADLGDEIRIIDGVGNAATNNITLTSSGKIQASDSDFIVDINRAGIGFVYYNSTQGWIQIEN